MGKQRHILFIGDSITDSFRLDDEEGLGYGYVRIIRDYLQTTYPDQYKITNKGISGNRVIDLEARWEEDVLAHEPDYVSISIGINDVWRQLDNNAIEQVYPDRFEEVYRRLCEQTKAKLIFMEPTVIQEDPESIGNQKLKDYVDIVRKLAKEYNGILVPTHESFLNYLNQKPTYPLTTDGVHMNSAGNMLMATTWLKACKELF